MRNALPAPCDDTGTVFPVRVGEVRRAVEYVEEHPACALDDTGTVSAERVEEPLAHAGTRPRR